MVSPTLMPWCEPSTIRSQPTEASTIFSTTLAFRNAHLSLHVGITLGNEIARLIQVRPQPPPERLRLKHPPLSLSSNRQPSSSRLAPSRLARRAAQWRALAPRALPSMPTRIFFHHSSLSKANYANCLVENWNHKPQGEQHDENAPGEANHRPHARHNARIAFAVEAPSCP